MQQRCLKGLSKPFFKYKKIWKETQKMASLSNAVTIIVVFAILIQFLVDRVKELVGDKVMNIVKAPVWAVAFGALFALMFDIDFFAFMGYSSQLPIIAKVITGLILSSGSTGVHELVAKLRESRVDS
jgi:divalent metal cation (Fe/Co/Zn/Cd) transporter